MELSQVMRTNGACRRFLPDEVPTEILRSVVDDARFGPAGGNRQGVRFIAVRDKATKRQLGEWYGIPAKKAIAEIRANERAEEAADHTHVKLTAQEKVFADQVYMSENMADIPVITVVVANLEMLHLTDTNLDRMSISGGASIYPIVQNFLLGLRARGLGSTLTTLLLAYEPQIREMLSIPDEYAMACVIPVGYPAVPFPKKLSRLPVDELLFEDVFGRSATA